MLRTQYRMPAAVAALVAEDYYLGRLRTGRRRAPAIRLPFADVPVVLVDTSGLEPTVRRGTRANPVHAAVVAAVVDAVKRAPDGRAARVGVYTLYRDQVDALHAAQHAEQREQGARTADATATVHRAQGGEVDVAVIDLCDGPGAGVTFLAARTTGDAGARLLNVAVTRAREALVVIANVAYLERRGGPVVRHLLGRLREHGVVVDACDLLG
jgi:superfamily I DNA and/or RNA helicase